MAYTSDVTGFDQPIWSINMHQASQVRPIQPLSVLLQKCLLVSMLLKVVFVYVPFLITGAAELPLAVLEAKQVSINSSFPGPLSLIGFLVVVVEPILSGTVLILLLWAEYDVYRFKPPFVSGRSWLVLGIYSAYFALAVSPFGYAAMTWVAD